jgi:AAA domain, putative AbiEii toxin, Type IV TA system
MLNYLKLTNVGPSPKMEIHLKPRMNFLAGDNGLGKTFLLDIAWWVLTQTWARAPATPPRRAWKTREGTARGTSAIGYGYGKGPGRVFENEGIYNRSEQYWTLKPGRRAINSMVIYAQVDGGFSAWDPARNYWKEKDLEQPERLPADPYGTGGFGLGGFGLGGYGGKAEQPERPRSYRFKPEEVWHGLPIDSPKKLCNGLILDWASWQRENGDAFGQLTRVLQALSPGDKERLRPGKLMRIGLDDTRDHPTLALPYKQEVPLIFASAGIRRIVALAYLLVWTWQEHLRACEIREMKPAKEIIFLIDEIEAHLHPEWQRRIVKALLDVMEALTGNHTVSIQMIATTHAPLVLASVEPYFEPAKDVIWELDLVDDHVELNEFPWRRMGDVNNWLTSTVFDLSQPRGLEAEEALGEALELLRRAPKPPVEEFERVDAKLRRALSDVDRFWICWSDHLDQKPR